MRKLFFLLLSVLLLTCHSASATTINDAIDLIPQNAGDYFVTLDSADISAATIELPTDRGLDHLTIEKAPATDHLNIVGLERIIANGISLTIGEGISLPDCSIYGGAYAGYGEELVLESSEIVLNGEAAFLFGGGIAMDGGTSVVNNSFIIVSAGADVAYEVFGGGHAAGEGSVARVDASAIECDGSSDYVLGGGLAEYGGSAVTAYADTVIGEHGDVRVALFAGSSAADEGSHAESGIMLARLTGRAAWAFSGDFAYNGGTCELTKYGSLVVEKEGYTGSAYIGSFASSEGSSAEINTAQLTVCGIADDITEKSLSTDGGKAHTMIVAHFPCSEH